MRAQIRALVCGGVYKVKPLAVLAMIDDGELDWKVCGPLLRRVGTCRLSGTNRPGHVLR